MRSIKLLGLAVLLVFVAVTPSARAGSVILSASPISYPVGGSGTVLQLYTDANGLNGDFFSVGGDLHSFFDVFIEIDLPAIPPSPGVPFDTEMLSMNLIGGPTFGPGLTLIRESPTRPSLGRSTILPGGFAIDSFFDVFTELSIDGGQTWYESQGPSQMHISTTPDVPEPGTLLLLGTGLSVVARRLKKR